MFRSPLFVVRKKRRQAAMDAGKGKDPLFSIFDVETVDQAGGIIFWSGGIGFGVIDELKRQCVFTVDEILFDVNDERVGVFSAAILLLQPDIVDGEMAGVVATDIHFSADN